MSIRKVILVGGRALGASGQGLLCDAVAKGSVARRAPRQCPSRNLAILPLAGLPGRAAEIAAYRARDDGMH
jgi:hypothetical protein